MSDWVSISPPGNNAKSGALGHGEMMSLDESSFPALELNNRRLSVKNSFCRKNGLYTRCGSLHGEQEDGGLRTSSTPGQEDSWAGSIAGGARSASPCPGNGIHAQRLGTVSKKTRWGPGSTTRGWGLQPGAGHTREKVTRRGYRGCLLMTAKFK